MIVNIFGPVEVVILDERLVEESSLLVEETLLYLCKILHRDLNTVGCVSDAFHPASSENGDRMEVFAL